MVTEQYVSFETAKLLKEKGFNELCIYSYIVEPDYNKPKLVQSPIGKGSRYLYNASTQQMAMRWLREVYHIFIKIDYVVPKKIWAVIHKGDDMFVVDNDEHNYLTYEEAYEAAIKYCLENLI